MIKNVDVIIFVEHKDRELESIEKLSETLKESGLKILVLSIHFHLHYLMFYKAKVYVFPYLINRHDWPCSLVYKMYGNSVRYLNLNWEQLLSKANIAYKKPQDEFVKNEVSHIAWNQNFKDYLILNGVRDGNVHITGNPANEILFEMTGEYDKWRQKLSMELGLNIQKKWIFFPMNYAWAFATDSKIKSKIAKGFPADVAWDYRAYSKKCLLEFIPFVNELSKNKHTEIIIRPHPTITESDYEAVFNTEIGFVPDNVLINKSYSIREWIVASDLIGSSWSTSVWDAYNIGKPAFLFNPYERPDWLHVWWNDTVCNISKVEDLDSIKKVDGSFSVAKTSELISGLVKNLYEGSSPKLNKGISQLSLKEILKIMRCLARNSGMLRNPALEYDKFNVFHK